jgi:hypothetical protein
MKSARILVLFASLALLAAACGGGGDAVDDLEPGDCFDDQPDLLEITTVELIDCAEPHDLEAFHVGNIGIPGAYPGLEALEDAAAEICEGPLFEAYVGLPYFDSELFTTWYVPTEESWEQGDYEVICLVFDVAEDAAATGELQVVKMEGSARGSGR